MAGKLRWGILGTGMIARKFAEGLSKEGFGGPTAVGSRTLESAQTFTSDLGGRPVAGYEELVNDPEVDAIYISLPHHMHAEWTIKCAEAGKHILCEKPFTLNALEAERALEAVRKAGVFFMEAFMYRCHPQTHLIREEVRKGSIGRPMMIHAEFGFQAQRDSGGFRQDARVGGGAMMDVGCYPVSFSRWVAGEEPSSCSYKCEFYKGYDAHGAGVMAFPSGLQAYFATSIHLQLNNRAVIYGDEGRIEVSSPWFAGGGPVTIHPRGGEARELEVPGVDDLWGFQATLIESHLSDLQCPAMTWADTLGNMRAMDALRASAGLVFEAEPRA